MSVIVFHRVFNRDDMAVALLINDIEHARQRRGFAGAGRPRHQNQPARLEQQVTGLRRQANLLQRQHLRRNLAQHNADMPLLAENTHAESRHFAKAEAEV